MRSIPEVKQAGKTSNEGHGAHKAVSDESRITGREHWNPTSREKASEMWGTRPSLGGYQ